MKWSTNTSIIEIFSRDTSKASRPGGLQGYLIKAFTSCHGAVQLQLCLEMNEMPDWFITGRTVLTMKDREKGNDATNNMFASYVVNIHWNT